MINSQYKPYHIKNEFGDKFIFSHIETEATRVLALSKMANIEVRERLEELLRENREKDPGHRLCFLKLEMVEGEWFIRDAVVDL